MAKEVRMEILHCNLICEMYRIPELYQLFAASHVWLLKQFICP